MFPCLAHTFSTAGLGLFGLFFFPLDYFSASEFPVTDTRCAGDEQCRNTRRDETEKKHLFCALSFVLGVSSVGCLTW